MGLRWVKGGVYTLFFSVFVLLVGCNSFSIGPAAGVSKSSTTLGQKPSQIALLLPLQGANAGSAEAIRNGFLTAYYYAKQQQSDAPAVTVVDTSGGNIVDLYQRAVADGANFIVGPLTKANVQTLASTGQLSVPTLALNTLDNNTGAVRNLYQFGLSPQDEAVQVAERAQQEGHSRALIIAPAGAWGQGIAQAFTRRWQAMGGTVVDNYGYLPKGDYSAGVRNLLRANSAAPNAQNKSRFVAKSRTDVDMVFLVAFPAQARQIKPLLGFYNAGNLPVYATSLIYAGSPSPQNDRDLEGVEFNDMPWIIGPDTPQWNEMRQHIKMLWAGSYNTAPRLYAFGIDAYHLTYKLNSLMHSATLSGATGVLTVNANQSIKRRLNWAKIQDGVPVAVR